MKRNLIQFYGANQEISVGLVHPDQKVEVLAWIGGVYELAKEAIFQQCKLADLIEQYRTGAYIDYDHLEAENRLLSPIAHKNPAHILVSGTGLTHLGSADTRATMHAKLAEKNEAELTDTMRMFRLGLEGGKPEPGEIGVQPEWFYKGDGDSIVPPGGDILAPAFGLDFGDEVEIAGVYLIGEDKKPYRLGFVLGNEFSDHKTEKLNYLYLAHSKLRPCSFGPELALGDLPSSIEGVSRVIRDGKVIWEKGFFSGEDHMCHSLENLEHHHFKYANFLRPGDIHIHFFGTSTLSFSDQVETQENDVFEVQSSWFGKALRNTYRKASPLSLMDCKVTAL